jgi:uroporphyrinogen-III decarboxylase
MTTRLEAGVQAIQIFDSWAGSHYERGYAAFVVPGRHPHSRLPVGS